MHRIAAPALALLALTGCAAAEPAPPAADARAEVESAIIAELVPATVLESAQDGDEAALEFVDNMHELGGLLAADIIDQGRCGSPAYRSSLNQPELQAAHDRGCAVAAAHGVD